MVRDDPSLGFHASCPVYSFGFLDFFFFLVSLPVFTSAIVLSSPHEWKIRNGQHKRSSPEQLAAEGKKKHGFGRNVYISVGSGKAMVGLWVSRDVFFEGTDALREEKRGGLVADRTEGSGSSARPLPGKGAPSPACGSVLVRRQGTVSRFRVFGFFLGGGGHI